MWTCYFSHFLTIKLICIICVVGSTLWPELCVSLSRQPRGEGSGSSPLCPHEEWTPRRLGAGTWSHSHSPRGRVLNGFLTLKVGTSLYGPPSSVHRGALLPRKWNGSLPIILVPGKQNEYSLLPKVTQIISPG